MTAYSPTAWVNNTPPPLSAANLNKLTNELKLQAGPSPQGVNIPNTLPTWVDGGTPAITDPAPLNEMERVVQLVQQAVLPASPYTKTTWAAGWTPARNATRFNRMEQQAASNRVAIDSSGGASTAYFVEDWSSGNFSASRWAYLNVHESPGWLDATVTGSSHCTVVNDPAGGGGKCARFEIQDADPPWPQNTISNKEEIVSSAAKTWNKSAVSVGDVRWFSTRIYFPYTATEKFEFPHGGTQPFLDIMELHSASGTSSDMCAQVAWEAYEFRAGGVFANYQNVFAEFYANGGSGAGTPQRISLWRMTDASANPYMTNHNRWIDIVWGERFATDNTGWLEIWVDGVNVFPRTNRATLWVGDNPYFKFGLYRRDDATFPLTGRSVIYFGRTTIGPDRPF